MRIEKIRLKNVGPHEDLVVELAKGLVGILGANGAGKSTLINSVYAALTNDFSRFGGTKADVIKNDCGRANSFIELTGCHRGRDFLLTRWLKPNKNQLNIGEKEYTKASEVNEAVERELNIPKSIIDKYVFVNQWDMFSFLSQTASERAKTFQHLCGVSSASKIHKTCSEYVNKIKGTEIIDNSLELTEQIETHEARLAELSDEFEADEKLQVEDSVIDEALVLLTKKEECDVALEFVTTKTLELEEVRESITEYKDQYLLAKQTRSFLRGELLKVKEHSLYPLTQQYSGLKTLCKDIRIVKKRVKAAAEDRQTARAAVAELEEEDSDRIDEIDTRQEELLALKGLQSHFDEFSKANFIRGEECPTCKQSVDKHHIEQIRSEVKARELELGKLQDEYEELVALRQRHEELVDAYTWAVNVHEKAKEQLAWHEDELPEGFERSDLKVIGELAAQARGIRTDLRKNSKDRILGLKAMVQELRKQEKKLAAEIKANQELVDQMPDADDFIAASDLIEKQQELEHRLDTLEKLHSEVNLSAERLKGTLKNLKSKLAEQAKIRNLTEVISETGDLFHWNNLPKIVAQSNMELLVGDINENLELFNDPFFVEASDDLTFRVFFPGKPPVKASQLSGGQKVVLAIAFRAALDRVFGHDAGMMFLDEPTAGLDADNITYFHEALEQLASKVTESRQLVVITHVQELGGVFDQVVEIQKD